MTSDVSRLVKQIGAAAQQGEFEALRVHWQALYDKLKAGHPIEDADAYHLVAALDEAGTLDHLAGDASGNLPKLAADLCAHAQAGNDEALALSLGELKAHLDRSTAPLRSDLVNRIMTALLDASEFDAIVEIAERLIARGQDHAMLRRMYAQALMARHQTAVAVDVLAGIARSSAAPQAERQEANGLLGAAHKQLYIEASRTGAHNRSDILRQAIGYYRASVDGRSISEAPWPTINMIALNTRGSRDGIATSGQDEARRLAERLATEVRPRAERGTDPWDLLVMGEAYVAMGEWENAATWYGRFADSNDITPFQLGSAIRQLEQIWGVKADGSAPGQMLTALKTKLLLRTGGEIEMTASECAGVLAHQALTDSTVAQSILGVETPIRYEWLALAMKRPQAIARICRGAGLTEGTGFAIDPAQLSHRLAARFPNELLLLTNIHVVSSASHPTAMTPGEASIHFDHDDKETAHHAYTVWESAQDQLDAALLRLDPPLRPADVMPCPLAEDHAYDRLTPRSALEASGGRREKASDVYIIGHPLGQHLCFSMRDTEVLDKGSRHGSPHEYLHYRTPTAKGHSGSPVFDDTDWKVIALHHAGSGAGMMRQLSDPSRRHKANEGVAIKSIRRQVEIDFKNRRRQL